MRIARASCILGAIGLVLPAHAETFDECLLHAVQSSASSTTTGELRALCEHAQQPVTETASQKAETAATTAAHAKGVVEKRMALERYSRDNPFVLTPHRPNYLLPFVYTDHPNNASFDGSEKLQHSEVQFQLSVKVLIATDLIGDNGHLFFAYTNRSFWQAYNRELSSPFRETDHEPELILSFNNDWQAGGLRNSANQLILNHQSNGRSSAISRGWNRIMLNSVWEHDSFALSFMPWYRIPEEKKHSPDESGGDDNPDIEKYLGHFELRGMYQVEHGQTLSLMLRNNLRSDNRGAVEAAYSFPIGDTRLRGYLKYFNGYGESLIDYNAHIQSFGVGFLVSDWL